MPRDKNDPAHRYGDEIDPCELTPEVEAALDRANDAVGRAFGEAARNRQDQPSDPEQGQAEGDEAGLSAG